MSTDDLVKILSGEMTKWPSGKRIRLILRPESDTDTEYLRRISPRVAGALTKAFSRPGMKIAITDQECLDMVEKTPGAVGFSGLAQVVSEKRRVSVLDYDSESARAKGRVVRVALELPDNVLVTQLDKLVSWCRKNSLWPMPFATACCGIELMATGASRHDLARFGAEVFRFTPRQCDLMIVAGRVVMKMMPVLQRIWLQMPEPKWCMSMGACACSGGGFDTYAVVQGVDRFIPVDMYVPGCPPRPEQLIQAIIDLQDKIQQEGTIRGAEFQLQDRQQPKRALVELPILGQSPTLVSHRQGA